MKTKTIYYKIDQSLPPRHWYQRRVGWFGKSMLVIMMVTALGGGAFSYVMHQKEAKSLAAQTTNPDRLHKVTEALSTSAENIIDVQFVLDKWAKEHPGETWSVSARSIDGPKFEAQLNQDKSYESVAAGQLVLALPLFMQIPVEQHQGIKLDSGKMMATCVNLMIRLADETCGDEVSKYVDYRKVDGMLQKAGLHKTSLQGTKAKTTAADMSSLAAALHGDTLQKNARESVLKALREQRVRSGIPAACPGCVIANEASDNNGAHDTAIIQYGSGTYVLSIFTKDGSLTDVSELAGRLHQKILDTLSSE